MFKGQFALITGGSRGLGFAIASKLAQEGANVTLVSRNTSALKKAVERLSLKHDGQKHFYQSVDLLNLVDPNSSSLPVMQNLLNLNTILVNCAGVTTSNLLHKTSHTQTLETLNLNLTVPILLSQMAIRNMIRHRKLNPSILNISSILSYTEHLLPGTSVYAASKAGLLGFTTSLANELKGRIRVNALLPGLMRETDMGSLVTTTNFASDVSVSVSCVANEALKILENLSMNGECIILDNKLQKG
ncbi:hypothetical protein KGF56_002361 [Candida oxycetoniae]|uniref:3-oxoacyl-[acyl-carrier-protein] reductase n=1 Tax=Candida oxycetoniae TaxID=497107 RepID=A0AAI9SXU3_9ASCO|nr:uncharacterized protein KGF56_002361 [Candida oxycetoniae]KAI3404844.2 hypothetical protein KGF56_002361 [Candida oxycetoniae]